MSQFIEMFKDKKTNGKIADLVDTDIKSVKKLFNKDDLIEYIDISSVNAKSRTLNEMTQYIVSSAPSRAQQSVQNGDILVSTVRPINRNVAVVGCDLTNLVASTGFCVLRPKDGYREYLLSIVTSDEYTGKMCDIASGGLYPAVNNGDVLSYDIFIPDKDFLNRITQIYRQADKSGFDELKSQFIEMFGDPLKNPKNYTQRKLGDVATLLNGRAYKASELLSSGRYLVLRVGNFFTNTDYYYSDLELEPDKYCDTGDILYSWSATLGAQIWKGGKVIYHYHIWKVLFDENILNKEYFCFMLNVMTDSLKQETHGSTMVHLTKDGMEKKFIAIPPLELQRRFVSIAEQADKSGSVLQYMIAC